MIKIIRVAINGFGRIGRAAYKIAIEDKKIDIVAINDLTDPNTLAHLLRYDSVYGAYEKKVIINSKNDKKFISVDKKKSLILAIPEPEKLPWKNLKIDVVLECTGRFTNPSDAKKHLEAGAKKVIISAPASGDGANTLVLGTTKTTQRLKDSDIISNASCTTNCISPVVQVLVNKFGIEKALMTTVHAVTAEQSIVDGPHKDLRRARSALINIVPTTTGAAIATTKVIPELTSLFDGVALRVPVIVGSISDITCLLKKNVTVEEVNNSFKEAVKNPLFKGILSYTEDPIVSSDIIGSPYSAIVDLSLTRVSGGNLVKVFAWYDNEFGYSKRLIDLLKSVMKK